MTTPDLHKSQVVLAAGPRKQQPANRSISRHRARPVPTLGIFQQIERSLQVVGTPSWTGLALPLRLNVFAAIARCSALEGEMRFDPIDCTHAAAHDKGRDRLPILLALVDVQQPTQGRSCIGLGHVPGLEGPFLAMVHHRRLRICHLKCPCDADYITDKDLKTWCSCSHRASHTQGVLATRRSRLDVGVIVLWHFLTAISRRESHIVTRRRRKSLCCR